jgi:hypothetical protein
LFLAHRADHKRSGQQFSVSFVVLLEVVAHVADKLRSETEFEVKALFELVVEIEGEDALEVCDIVKLFQSRLVDFEVLFGVVFKYAEIGAEGGGDSFEVFLDILILQVEGLFHDGELLFNPGDVLEIESIFKETVDFAFLNFGEGQITHTQRLKPHIVDQDNIRYAIGNLGVLIGDIGQVRDIVVHEKLLIEFFPAQLDPNALVVEELLELPLLAVLPIHLLKDVILENAQTRLFKLVYLLIHRQFVFVNCAILVTHVLSLLKCARIRSPVACDWVHLVLLVLVI